MMRISEQDLADRQRMLLMQLDLIRLDIERHEFDMASIRARDLRRLCEGANLMANAVAEQA